MLPHLLLGRQPTTTISSTDRSNQRTASGPRECSPCAVFVSSRERVRSCPHAREPPRPPRRLKMPGRTSSRRCSHEFCRAQRALEYSARDLRMRSPRSAEDSCGEYLYFVYGNDSNSNNGRIAEMMKVGKLLPNSAAPHRVAMSRLFWKKKKDASHKFRGRGVATSRPLSSPRSIRVRFVRNVFVALV